MVSGRSTGALGGHLTVVDKYVENSKIRITPFWGLLEQIINIALVLYAFLTSHNEAQFEPCCKSALFIIHLRQELPCIFIDFDVLNLTSSIKDAKSYALLPNNASWESITPILFFTNIKFETWKSLWTKTLFFNLRFSDKFFIILLNLLIKLFLTLFDNFFFQDCILVVARAVVEVALVSQERWSRWGWCPATVSFLIIFFF